MTASGNINDDSSITTQQKSFTKDYLIKQNIMS